MTALSFFQGIPEYLAVAPALRRIGVVDQAVEGLVEAVRVLQDLSHEGEPVRSCLTYLSNDMAVDVLGPLALAAATGVTAGQSNEFRALAQLADGLDRTILVRPSGDVIGVVMLPDVNGSPNTFVPRRYWAHSSASPATDGLLFLFSGRGRVQAFAQGARILSFRPPNWHRQPTSCPESVARLASQHQIAPGILDATLAIALEMSDLGYGELFTLGDEAAVQALAAPASTLGDWGPTNVRDSDRRLVITRARADGATIIAGDGGFVRSQALLYPAAGASGPEEAGVGGRHKTAASTSAVTSALTVAVSADGTITFYSGGRAVDRRMG